MVRRRSCDSPPPMNGGRECVGPSQQAADCNSLCPPVAGGWSSYGPWSSCDSSCRQYRHRTCSDPAPQHGGTPCEGPDRISRNCSRDMCSGGVVSGLETTRTNQGARAVPETDVALYVGLAVALVVFPLIALLALKLYRRKGRGQSMYGLTERDYEARYYDNSKKQLGYAPDLTSSVAIMNPTPPSLNSDYSYGDPNSNKTALLSSPSEHHYDEPHAMFLPKRLDSAHNSGADSETSTAASPVSRAHQAGDSGTAHSHSSYCSSPTSPHGKSLYGSEPASCRQSLLSVTLPSDVNPDNLELATVTSAGAVLSLAEAGVSLTIPEGALAEGQQEEIYLVVLNDSKGRPQLGEHETLLSPVVLAGPGSVQLLRPAIVSFQHCASLKTNWSISVFGGTKQWPAPGGWHHLALLGKENLNTGVYTHLDQQRVHVLVDTLQPLALVGEPGNDSEGVAGANSGPAVKLLRLAAFGPRLVAGCASEYCIRCYVVEDTRAAFEAVLQLERRLAGRLLDKPKTMAFESGGGGLSLSLEDLSIGWRCKPQGDYQEIPFWHVWGSACPLLHCSFSLEHVGRGGSGASRGDGLSFSARVLVSQKGGTQTRRQMLRVSSAESGPLPSPLPGRPTATVTSSVSTNTSGSSGASSTVTVTTLDTGGYRLSAETRQKLCQLLNQPSSRLNDWRMLAQRMQVNRFINYFAAKKSPTECLLDLWWARHADPSAAATELLNILRIMGRDDAAHVLEAQLGPRV
ncbi:netrin receptor UNC5C-like [Amphibalanus amphitrite]|uniref:netrin receptor UNC5C-like n=1 Tax=Amphibalanus amphitrite TaxID=1232801 RepID=UPI001C916314|nr:netrin receptor UNC5C-like [Amphibalanus amphitrite]